MPTPSNDIIFSLFILFYLLLPSNDIIFVLFIYFCSLLYYIIMPTPSNDIIFCLLTFWICFWPAPGLCKSPPPPFLLDRVKFGENMFSENFVFDSSGPPSAASENFCTIFFFSDFLFACKLATEFWLRRLRMRSCRVTRLCPQRGMRLISRSWNLALFSGSCA